MNDNKNYYMLRTNSGFTVPMVSKYIQKLKRNSAPAADGITAEHLIYSADSDMVRHITKMLTLCVQFGVVPDNFTNGLLIPIPKKAGCDTSVPKNWRPCNSHIYNFVKNFRNVCS